MCSGIWLWASCCTVFTFPWVFCWHQWNRISGRSPDTFCKQSEMGFSLRFVSREGCCARSLCLGTSNSQQITLKVTPSASSGSVGSSWLQREVSGHFLFTYWVVDFFYYIFFLTRFLGTSCWLNREDCYCHWEGRKPVCLHCWVRKTSKSSCCPVSWNDKENPYGYKNWSH